MKKRLLLVAAMILSVGGLSTCGNGRLSEFGARSSEKTVKKTESKETQTLKKVLAAPESQANPWQVAAKRRSIRLNRSRCRQRTSTMIRITRRSSTAFFNRGKINEKKAGNYGCDFACDMRTVRLRRQR